MKLRPKVGHFSLPMMGLFSMPIDTDEFMNPRKCPLLPHLGHVPIDRI
jgi:hypothetical protein